MKKYILFFCIFGCHLVSVAQISIPYEKYYSFNDFPKSNDLISFTLPNPFVAYKDSVPDNKTTYQKLISFSLVRDSLLSECIKFAMLSLNYEQKFRNVKKGTEIWYGVSKGTIPTFAGIYYKNFPDSSRMYVLTTFSLTYFDKKRKDDISRTICNRIKLILAKHQKQK